MNEVESPVNSRPLTNVSDITDDYEAQYYDYNFDYESFSVGTTIQ